MDGRTDGAKVLVSPDEVNGLLVLFFAMLSRPIPVSIHQRAVHSIFSMMLLLWRIGHDTCPIQADEQGSSVVFPAVNFSSYGNYGQFT